MASNAEEEEWPDAEHAEEEWDVYEEEEKEAEEEEEAWTVERQVYEEEEEEAEVQEPWPKRARRTCSASGSGQDLESVIRDGISGTTR